MLIFTNVNQQQLHIGLYFNQSILNIIRGSKKHGRQKSNTVDAAVLPDKR